MKNKKYHTVGTVPKSNRKTRNTTLSEQFQNLTDKSLKDAKLIPQSHKYVTAHFLYLAQALQSKVVGLN